MLFITEKKEISLSLNYLEKIDNNSYLHKKIFFTTVSRMSELQIGQF